MPGRFLTTTSDAFVSYVTAYDFINAVIGHTSFKISNETHVSKLQIIHPHFAYSACYLIGSRYSSGTLNFMSLIFFMYFFKCFNHVGICEHSPVFLVAWQLAIRSKKNIDFLILRVCSLKYASVTIKLVAVLM